MEIHFALCSSGPWAVSWGKKHLFDVCVCVFFKREANAKPPRFSGGASPESKIQDEPSGFPEALKMGTRTEANLPGEIQLSPKLDTAKEPDEASEKYRGCGSSLFVLAGALFVVCF